MANSLSPKEFAAKYLNMRVYIYPPEDGGPDNSAPGMQTGIERVLTDVAEMDTVT